MNRVKFVLPIFLILPFRSLLSQNIDSVKPPQIKDSLKCWSGDKLTWSDFKKSVPLTNGKLSDGAQCSCTPVAYVVIEEDSTYSYKVRTIFYRYKSWANKDTSKYISMYLLAHEQLHFDMSELYARKMRKAFKELGNWSESKDKAYKALIKKIYADHIAQQNDYDAKTNHGTIKVRHQEWENKIFTEMEQLKSFASTLGDCH